MVEVLTTGMSFDVHQDDLSTMSRAVNERVFYVTDAKTGLLRPPFQPQSNIFDRELGRVKQRFLRLLSTTPIWKLDTFVEQYNGRRRTIYERAASVVRSRRVTSTDARIKGFGKPEKTNVTKKPDAVQRVISPRNPVFNVAVGIYIKPFEHKVYTGIKNLWGQPVIAKGLNAIEVASLIKRKFTQFRKPCAIGVDAKRFDQHCSVAALEFEHSIYNGHFKCPELKRLLKMQLHNQVSIRCSNGRISYKVRGGRMSGDMNTALGNCLLMCLMMYSFRTHCGVHFELINNGDDCVLFCEETDRLVIETALFDYFKAFGYEMVCEPSVSVLEQVEFCQARPVFNGEGYVMVRDPAVTQSKDAMSLQPFESEDHFRSWLNTVGSGGLSLTAGIPIEQSYYEAMIRNGNRTSLRQAEFYEAGLFRLGVGIDQHSRPITSEARYSFFLAFGITPDSQVNRESYLEQVTIPYSYALDELGEVKNGKNKHPAFFGQSAANFFV